MTRRYRVPVISERHVPSDFPRQKLLLAIKHTVNTTTSFNFPKKIQPHISRHIPLILSLTPKSLNLHNYQVNSQDLNTGGLVHALLQPWRGMCAEEGSHSGAVLEDPRLTPSFPPLQGLRPALRSTNVQGSKLRFKGIWSESSSLGSKTRLH